MKKYLIPSIKLTLMCMLLFAGAYTLAILGIAQFTPNNGRGEIVAFNGNKYYTNIGQRFISDRYFNSRPSAVAYNAAGSGGSNKGPTNPDYLKEVETRIDTFLAHNPTIKKSEIPSELVTASGSGLDPNISVQAALIQIPRIAKLRQLQEKDLELLLQQQIQKPLFGFFGPETINVLNLNLALEKLEKDEM